MSLDFHKFPSPTVALNTEILPLLFGTIDLDESLIHIMVFPPPPPESLLKMNPKFKTFAPDHAPLPFLCPSKPPGMSAGAARSPFNLSPVPHSWSPNLLGPSPPPPLRHLQPHLFSLLSLSKGGSGIYTIFKQPEPSPGRYY